MEEYRDTAKKAATPVRRIWRAWRRWRNPPPRPPSLGDHLLRDIGLPPEPHRPNWWELR